MLGGEEGVLEELGWKGGFGGVSQSQNGKQGSVRLFIIVRATFVKSVTWLPKWNDQGATWFQHRGSSKIYECIVLIATGRVVC